LKEKLIATEHFSSGEQWAGGKKRPQRKGDGSGRGVCVEKKLKTRKEEKRTRPKAGGGKGNREGGGGGGGVALVHGSREKKRWIEEEE